MDHEGPEPSRTPEPPARPRRRRRNLWIAAGVSLLVLGGGLAFLAAAQTGPSEHAFRFDAIYVSAPSAQARNETPIKIDMWFTNTEQGDLRRLQIVAVVVDTQRNLQVARSEHQMGGLDGRQTRNAEIALMVNLSRPYRIDLLVLADGLLVAKGEGGFGGYYYDDSRFHLLDRTSEADLTTKATEFQVQYYER